MFPKDTSCKKPHDIKITQSNIEKGKSPVVDIKISAGWSVKRRDNSSVIDQVFHVSVIACLLVLASYIFIVHKLIYYETLDSTSLKNRFEYLLKLNEQLSNSLESTKYDLDSLRSDHDKLQDVVNALRTEFYKEGDDNTDHVRRRRSANQNKDWNRTRKRNRCNRTRTETVAVQFRGCHDGYDTRPMEGVLGPWVQDFNVNDDLKAFGVSLKESDRKLEISRAGLYFIYSQVTYHSKSALSSYSINVISTSNATGKTDNKASALCSTVGQNNIEAEISCYTSTVRFLYPRDIVYLQQNEKNQTILFEDEMTYLGVIRLSDA